MLARRIAVRPVNKAALLVPDILAGKTYRVSYFQIFDSRGKVRIVCNQDCLPGRDAYDKSLMGKTRGVVGKQS